MTRFIALLITAAVLFHLGILRGAPQLQSHSKPAPPRIAGKKATSAPSAPEQLQRAAWDPRELAEMKSDLAKMRSLLSQMEVNLGFVQTSQTPLKHQFELDLEMWRLLFSHMDRRIQRMENAGEAPPASPPS
jgi:hypothetical protein